MVKSVETAKQALVDEVEHVSYTNGDPFGNAGSYRKVLEYLYQCAINSLPPSEVVE